MTTSARRAQLSACALGKGRDRLTRPMPQPVFPSGREAHMAFTPSHTPAAARISRDGGIQFRLPPATGGYPAGIHATRRGGIGSRMAFPGAPETNATLATRDAHATAQLSKPRPARRGPVPPPPLPSGVIRPGPLLAGRDRPNGRPRRPRRSRRPRRLRQSTGAKGRAGCREAEHGCQRQSRMPGGRARVPKAEPDAGGQSTGAVRQSRMPQAEHGCREAEPDARRQSTGAIRQSRMPRAEHGCREAEPDATGRARVP